MDLVDPSSESGKEFKKIVWQIMVETGKPNLADYFPILKRVDPQGAKRRMTACFRRLLDVFDRIIAKRLQDREAAGKNDMLDTLLELAEDSKEGVDLFHIKHLFLVSQNFCLCFNFMAKPV